MGEMKPKPTEPSAKQFIAKVADPARRADAESLLRIFQRATGDAPARTA